MVSVQSKNLFDLLAGSGDEGTTDVVAAAAPAAAKSKSSEQSKKSTAADPAPHKKAATPARENRVRNEYRPRHANKAVALRPRDAEGSNDAGNNRTGGGFRGERAPRDSEGHESSKRDKADRRHGGRAGPQSSHGRPFDRHSGGHRDSARRSEKGWGKPTDVVDGEKTEGAEGEKAAEVTEPEDPEAAAAAAAAAAEERRIREEEEKQKTLDQYLSEKASAARAVALPEARKANEGADATQWKDAVLLKGEEEQFLFAGKESSGKNRRKERNVKTHLDIEQRFPARARPERSDNHNGNGAGRGFRGGNDQRNHNNHRGDRRNNNTNNNSKSINVGDENAFPTLQKK